MNYQKSPKKSLGQNFLRDKGILRKIVNFAQIKKDDLVVEVGPGEGTLTEILLHSTKKVICIEKDKRMVELLNEKFKKEIAVGKLEVIEGDVLKLKSWSLNLGTSDFKLLGNIPYYITGALFKKALETPHHPTSITFVIQKEVAQRIMASHSTKATQDKRSNKESILSISIKAYGEPDYGGVIKAGSFYPKPKVDSAIISIRNISKGRFIKAKIREEKFFEIVKFGFAHKRKLLTSNLSGILETEKIKGILKNLEIKENIRAEDLTIEEWFKISQLMSTQK